MTRTRFNRRSFLGQVVGGGLGVGALAAIGAARAQEPRRRMAIDTDPNDPARVRASPYDADTGASADSPASVRAPGVTDSDSGAQADPAGRGRGGRRHRGVTDSDAGANADAGGQGRGGGSAEPAPAPGQPANQGALDSFVICPGHPRCPT